MKIKLNIKKDNWIFTFFNFPVLTDKATLGLLALNLSIIVSVAVYTVFRFKYLNLVIPLWYTRVWGNSQLAPNEHLYIIPAISMALLVITIIISNQLYINRNKEAQYTTLTLLTVAISFLAISAIRIVTKATLPYPTLFPKNIVELITPGTIALVICLILVPYVIKFAKAHNIITDPNIHAHPGMLLKKPSARAGALAFYLAFLATALFFVPLTRETVGIYIGTLITTIIGLLDDKKNLSPYLRLGMLPLAIIITLVVADLHVFYFANPFNGTTIRLDMWQFPIKIGDLRFTFLPIADVFTTIWILWFMNMLSWSNAVDGQFSGMVAICCIVTALLSLRLLDLDPEQITVARLAVIAAGASLGILPYNWHPSKIMWGFGATTMGLLIPILSIMAGTKVAVATLVLIVPTLDSVVTMIRRVLQGKSPVWGDRGHLHHRLLDMGLTQQEVSIFYWVITAIFGGVALIASGQAKILAVLTIGGLIAFLLVSINLKGELGKLKSQELEK